MSLPRIELVAAVAANGVIGRGGQLPWHLPDDLKRFKALTIGHPILMGRRTYESIGRPLPGRRNVVISQTLTERPHADVHVARSLDEALEAVGEDEVAFVIGGSVLYAAAIPRADVLHLTELEDAVEGDATFPPFDRGAFELVEETAHPRDERHAHGFYFRTYRRLRA